MRKDVKNDLSNSSYDFQRAVWPVIKSYIGGGTIQTVESVFNSGFNKKLDTVAGIDAWQFIKEKGLIRGIASRVQWGKSWQTFTIRFSRPSGVQTEYTKRLSAINSNNGELYPFFTVQSYLTKPVRDGYHKQSAIIKTETLFKVAKHIVESKEKSEFHGIRTTYSKEKLLWIHWDYFNKEDIIIVNDETGEQQ